MGGQGGSMDIAIKAGIMDVMHKDLPELPTDHEVDQYGFATWSAILANISEDNPIYRDVEIFAREEKSTLNATKDIYRSRVEHYMRMREH